MPPTIFGRQLFMPSTIYKVTALITRQPPAAPPELLVFQHPSAGVQLPAGTVEVGESPESAVLREVAEETGLTGVQLLQPLGTLTQTLAENQRAMMRSSPLFIGPSPQAQALNFNLSRGNWVRLTATAQAFSEVVFEEYDLSSPSQVITRISGWLPSNLLATRLVRYFFHLSPTIPTPASWTMLAENRHHFRLHWVPLSPRPTLVEGQNHWLDVVDLAKLVQS